MLRLALAIAGGFAAAGVMRADGGFTRPPGGLMNTQHPSYQLVWRPCDANIEVAAGWGV